MGAGAMDFPEFLLYFAASAMGSAINAVAGGGTFLTFPILIMSGMGALQANIMSTIALWPGSVASALAYRGQLLADAGELAAFKKFLKKSIVVSVLGSIIGTATLLLTPEQVFQGLVPWLLLFASLIFAFGRRVSIFSQGERSEGRALGLQFLIAIYGGYFGAGIGILMLAMLQLLGLSDIHRMNALKTILGSSINGVAWIIFVISGAVVWPVGAVMIAGALTGGWFGAKLALKVPPQKVRRFVIVLAFAMTAYFFCN